jgi:alpha-L-rhamnosidase
MDIIRKFILCCAILFIAINSFATILNKSIVVANLCCNGMNNPEGVNNPKLSWKIYSPLQGLMQTSWEIQISSSKSLLLKGATDVWTSGKKLSDEQFNIIPKEYTFKEGAKYYWRVRIWTNKNKLSHWSEPAFFSIGLLNESSWKAKWITRTWGNGYTMPYFRKLFDLSDISKTKKPVRATIYFCGLGCGELYMNGKKVDSTRILDPAQTNYEQYALYSTYDVTPFIQSGKNCIGVMLGKGWYSQDIVWDPKFSYGNPMMRLHMEIIFSDGSKNTIGSDETWTWKNGPVVKSNIYQGELYDARLEVKDWCDAKTSNNFWEKALIVNRDENTIPQRLISQQIEPIRKKQYIKPIKIWQDSVGNWIFDFGINIAGFVQISVNQPEGTHLKMRMSEEKKQNGDLDFTSTGISYVGYQIDEYICNGNGKEVWSPRFTYHGFRFVELSGYKSTPDKSWLTAVVVNSDIAYTGRFECANDQLNRLHEMAVRTLVSNLQGVPTDCPQREKCGWLGDTHAYVKMSNLNFNMANFWEKYLADIRSSAASVVPNVESHGRNFLEYYQVVKPAGIPFMIAPGRRNCGAATPDWGTALVQLPWNLYLYYGNKDILLEYYEDMKTWTNWVGGITNPENIVPMRSRIDPNWKEDVDMSPQNSIISQGLGDWCPPGGYQTIETPVSFSSTAFHYLDVSIMEKVALLIDKNDDSESFAKEKKEIGNALVKKFYNPVTKTFGTQTADAMALDFGLLSKAEEKDVADAMAITIAEKYNGFMHMGIFGLSRLGSVLSRNGNSLAAFDLFTKKGENSFEWMWTKSDATTLWEVLPTDENSRKSAESVSHNHPMQAGFDVWFYEDIAGISPDIKEPGFKTIRFEPKLMKQLSWAKASIESPYGEVQSSWKNELGKIYWDISIPPNSTGLVSLPKNANIHVDSNAFDKAKYLPEIIKKDEILYRFPSGKYHILVICNEKTK